MEKKERIDLGIKGSIKLPDSDYFLVPGSVWNKWKTVVHGEPEFDESDEITVMDENNQPLLDELGNEQSVFRCRNLSDQKDVDYFKNEGIRVFKSFEHLVSANPEAGSMYVGKDGKIYNPARDNWTENLAHDAVRDVGGVFINDTYLKLWKKTTGFLFLDGSYGSGKTTFAITHLLLICLRSKKGKFNCFYGRQDKEMASQLHKNIINEIERNHWEHLFKYSLADNGSKNIHCVSNGGIFQLFGCNDDATIKGWNNPTHILVDEVNQISFDSFGMLQSRLRRPGVETLFIGCFNACDVIPIDSDDEGSWLWRYIFKESTGQESAEDKVKRKVFKSIGITIHHSDYLDNYCQNNFSYWYKLLVQAKFDTVTATRFATGSWGTKIGAQLYYNRFNYDKVVRPTLQYHSGTKILNGWDENTQPYQPSLIIQKIGNQYRFLKEYLGYNPNNNVHGVAPMIIKDFGKEGVDHRAGWDINGDATSKKENSALEKGQNYFTITQNLLKQFKPEIRVQDANPNNKLRGDFINLIFYQNIYGIEILISEEGCPNLIKDLQNVMQDIKNEKNTGKKDKSTKIVNGVRQVQPFGHLADIMDYVICENSMPEFLNFQTGDMTVDTIFGTRKTRNSWEGLGKKENSEDVEWNKKSRYNFQYKEVSSEDLRKDAEESQNEVDKITKRYFKNRGSKNSW